MWTRVVFLHQLVHSLMYDVLKKLIKKINTILSDLKKKKKVSMLNVSRVSKDSNRIVQILTIRWETNQLISFSNKPHKK